MKPISTCIEENCSIKIPIKKDFIATLKGSIHKPNDSELRGNFLFEKTYGCDFITHFLDPLFPKTPYQFYITNKTSPNCFFNSDSLIELSCEKFGNFTPYSIKKLLYAFGQKISILYYKNETSFSISDFFPETTIDNCLTMVNDCNQKRKAKKEKRYMIPSFLIPFLLDYIIETDKQIVVMCISQLKNILNLSLSGIEKSEILQFEENSKFVLEAIRIRLNPSKIEQWVIISSNGKLICDKIEKKESMAIEDQSDIVDFV
jgi:hypothetical protein